MELSCDIQVYEDGFGIGQQSDTGRLLRFSTINKCLGENVGRDTLMEGLSGEGVEGERRAVEKVAVVSGVYFAR